MKYLITGITGFVGPHLARLLLREGHEVYGLIRGSNGREMDLLDVLNSEEIDAINFVYGDLTDIESLNSVFYRLPVDGVFHLAAQSHPPTSFIDPAGTFRINAVGTINLLETAIKYASTQQFMMCSTSEVYGAVPEEEGLITEEFPIAPVNPYGVSKAAADLYVQERGKSLGRSYFVTRAFSHTGPRRGKKFSISSDAYQIARIIKGIQDEKVINVGNLESRRVVIDVRDCVRAYYMLMMQDVDPGDVFNVGGWQLFSIGDLLGKMLKLRGLEGKVELRKSEALWRPIDIPIQKCSTNKLRDKIEWRPEIDIEETLDDLLKYWEGKIGNE